MLLIESGIRIHITEYEWPKAGFPSGFSMKVSLSMSEVSHNAEVRTNAMKCGGCITGLPRWCVRNNYSCYFFSSFVVLYGYLAILCRLVRPRSRVDALSELCFPFLAMA